MESGKGKAIEPIKLPAVAPRSMEVVAEK